MAHCTPLIRIRNVWCLARDGHLAFTLSPEETLSLLPFLWVAIWVLKHDSEASFVPCVIH